MNALALSTLVLVCCMASGHAATSSAAFNGSWNLAFVTQSGTCDPTYNFTVNVSNGLVAHPNLVKFLIEVVKQFVERLDDASTRCSNFVPIK